MSLEVITNDIGGVLGPTWQRNRFQTWITRRHDAEILDYLTGTFFSMHSKPSASIDNSNGQISGDVAQSENLLTSSSSFASRTSSKNGQSPTIKASADERSLKMSRQRRFLNFIAPKREGHYFEFVKTKEFWLVVFLGQIISLCLTSTNTMTSIMGDPTSVAPNDNGTAAFPLFQNLFHYAFLALIYLPYSMYRYGFRRFGRICIYDGWKFFIFAFADVEGNYFVTKAYQYTNILSAALLDNFAIVVVVILSFIFLKVRYHWSQYAGIIITIGGMVILTVSDRLTGKDYGAEDPVKGDLFVLLGAACYGISNTLEEFFLSKKPFFEVVGFLGFFGVGITGVQLAIFDFERNTVPDAVWSPVVGGAFAGYILTMILLYHIAPLMFRLSSAAFYNLNTLTSDFWSVLVGTQAFGYDFNKKPGHYMYPIGFVCTILGIICYCAAPMTTFGESFKPWLGHEQEDGCDGIGTAKLRLEHERNNNPDADEDVTEGNAYPAAV